MSSFCCVVVYHPALGRTVAVTASGLLPEDLAYFASAFRALGGELTAHAPYFDATTLEHLHVLQTVAKWRAQGHVEPAADPSSLAIDFQFFREVEVRFDDTRVPPKFAVERVHAFLARARKEHADRFTDVYLRRDSVLEEFGSVGEGGTAPPSPLQPQPQWAMHLRASPWGVGRFGAESLLAGCDGQGVVLFDVERAWDTAHPAFGGRAVLSSRNAGRSNAPSLEDATPSDNDRAHGTMALGVVLAKHLPNTWVKTLFPFQERVRVSGIADAATAVLCDSGIAGGQDGGAARFGLSSLRSVIAAVVDHIKASPPLEKPEWGFNAVVLLEQTADVDGSPFKLPIEVFPDVWAVVRTLVDAGVTVIEPLANGNKDSSAKTTAANLARSAVAGQRFADRVTGMSDSAPMPHLARGDSGAVLVAAAATQSDSPQAPQWVCDKRSNYGPVAHCFAQGDWVATTHFDARNKTKPHGLTAQFQNTSAAAAIIAGVAVSVQGMALKNLGHCLGPEVLRGLLSAPEGGNTRAVSGESIGVMPNLVWIADQIRSGLQGKKISRTPPKS